MEKQICTDYNENFLTIAELTKKYNKSFNTIREILKNNNIHIRNNSENSILRKNNYKYSLEEIEKEVLKNYCENHFGLIKSGKKFHLSQNNTKYILKKNSVKIRNFSEATKISNQNRALYKDNNFFHIETKDMAWLLGFLAADSNISQNTNRIKIGLAIKDEEILLKIKELVKIENKIAYYTNKNGYEVCELSWTSSQNKRDLANYGIISQKSFILKPPYTLNRKYWIDYIRGYFDGDGSINLIKNSNNRGNGNLRFQICSANKDFLKWIINFLYDDYGIKKVNIYKQEKNRLNPLYYFQYSSIATRQIYNILYTDSKMFLKRKRDCFEKILKIVNPLYE